MKSFFPLLLFSLLFLFTGQERAMGQLNVDLQLGRRQFIPHEAIPMAVRLTNRAGKELTLYGDGRRPWLDIVVLDNSGNPIAPYGGKINFQAAKVPVGRAVAKRVDLNSYFPLNSFGRYTVYTIVTLPTGESFQSPRRVFSMSKGNTIYEQRVGLGGKARDYRLITFAPGVTSYLYFQAELVDERRVAVTYPIGEILQHQEPQATVDKDGKLHVLYLGSPDRHVHVLIDSTGKVAERTIYKRGPSGDPRLVPFADGEVKVAGGLEHDPEEIQKRRDKIRDITERPSVLYE